MGGVYVEIGADPRKFFSAMQKANKALAGMGKSLSSAGGKMMGMGAAALAPFAASVRSGAAYESTLLNIRASTGATAAEMERLRNASMTMSSAMGKGPTEIAGSFLELLKAGMSVEQVLGGAGKAALEFAAVGQMNVAEAAVVMSDAMNVFGVDASQAANAISSAADASSTSIQLMSQSFSMVSAVAALANQSIDDTSAALAILANSGVKGSDAGTSLKTMLMRLMAPAEDGAAALAQLGLSAQSFRNADGTMKPLVDMIGTLNGALGNMDQAAKDDIFRRIFGQDAIRAAAILTNAGVSGFTAMRDSMGNALPVGEKYKVLMSGLAGAGSRVMAALERLAIAVSDAVAPAVMGLADAIGPIISGFATFVSKNQELVASLAKGIALFFGTGAAMWAIGKALQYTSGMFSMLLNPIGLVIAGVAGVSAVVLWLSGSLDDVAALAKQAFGGIYDAMASGDLTGAMEIAMAGIKAIWLRGIESMLIAWYRGVGEIQKAFVLIGSAWDKYVTKPVSMLGVRVAEAAQERDVLGKFDTGLRGTIFDTEEKKQIRSRRKVAEDLLGSGTAEDFTKNKAAAQAMIADRQRVVDAGRAPGASPEEQQAAAEAAKEIEGFRDAISMVRARMAQLGIKTDEQRNADSATRMGEIDEATQKAIAGVKAGTVQAAQDLANTIRSRREVNARGQQAEDLGTSIGGATSIDQLRGMADEFHTLKAMGRLTSDQESKLATALDDATERIMGEGATSDPSKTAEQNAQGGAGMVATQAEVAGTFSSSLGGMGLGSSLAQKQLDEQKKTNQILEDKLGEGAVAA